MCSHADPAPNQVAATPFRFGVGRLVGLAALAIALAGWGCAAPYQEGRATAPRVDTANLGNELAKLRREQEALRQQVEQMARSVETLHQGLGTAESQIASDRSSLEKLYARVSELSKGLKMMTGGEVLEGSPLRAVMPSEEPPSLRSRYSEAYSDLKASNYAGAIEKFRVFLEHHPQSRLADNAQYWIAESYLSLKDYQRALEEYRRVERNYPNSNRVPDALLRSGETLYALGDIHGYVRELERVIQLFPGDRAAQVAAESIARLATE